MKVYVVTHGEYSEYGVLACLTDKEKANQLADIVRKYNYESAGVLEFDTQDKMIELAFNGYSHYYVQKGKDPSEPIKITYTDYIDSANVDAKVYDTGSSLFTEVLAKTEDHAIKIAADRFAKYEAEKQGL